MSRHQAKGPNFIDVIYDDMETITAGYTLRGRVPSSAALPSSGNVPGDAYVSDDTGHLWVWADPPGQWDDFGSFVGSAGPVGPVGPTGPQGPQGPQGVSGPTGPQGLQGARGAQLWASSNPVGSPDWQPAGARDGDYYLYSGDGQPGSTGAVYGPRSGSSWPLIGQIRGATGPQGAVGQQGPQGVQGPVGPQGPEGQGAVPVGTIVAYGGANAPSGWHLCNGTAHNSAALQQVLGSANTPNLVNRFVLGAGTRSSGETGGAEKVTLTTQEIPAHTHGGWTGVDSPDHGHYVHGNGNHQHSVETYSSDRGTGNANTVQVATAGGALAGATSWSGHHDHNTAGASERHGHMISSDGGSQPHNNMPPYYVLTYIIKT